MGRAVTLRADFDGRELRLLAKSSKDAGQSRRLLALAAINDGGKRLDAARIGSVGLQVVRDWVLRFNAKGPDGLIDGKATGQPAKLNDGQRQALVHGIGDRRGAGQRRHAGHAAHIFGRGCHALYHQRLHGRRLSGGHEDGGQLGEGRSRLIGGHLGWRPHIGLCIAASVQRLGRHRLALHHCRVVGDRARRRIAGQPGRPWSQPERRVAAVRCPQLVEGISIDGAQVGQFRLSRPYLGAVCHVGLAGHFPGRQLP